MRYRPEDRWDMEPRPAPCRDARCRLVWVSTEGVWSTDIRVLPLCWMHCDGCGRHALIRRDRAREWTDFHLDNHCEPRMEIRHASGWTL